MTAFRIGLNPLRDRDVVFFNADRGAVVDHRPLFGRWYVRGFYRLRDRDVDFLDAHQVLKMSNGRQHFGLVLIDTETSTFGML